MIYSMWVDQERVESMCTPSNLYVVTLSTGGKDTGPLHIEAYPILRG